ncbi:uracil-xanthine permease family protein [Mangrovimicrobium sediminis]|uniref:uracil-xanthine permease family protein n=1 Tax=Mangrovimicrobium sediminis TaxID=2562682 RepID=UPI0014366E6B|nr:solute carrier family 23 protein [Haliea sp. SAOS-164]
MSETPGVAEWREPLYGWQEVPPWPTALLAGFQHLLAVFGGIVTAPLIIAAGMGLSVADTNYLVTSALLISGLATIVQISSWRGVGSGLLSIQGTSFTFIGAILFAWHALPGEWSDQQRLAAIFGSTAACSVLMMGLGRQLHRLGRVITPAVTGATVVLLGLTLTLTTLQNLHRVYGAAVAAGEAWKVLLLAGTVLAVTIALALWRNPWCRMCAVMGGLGTGLLLALFLGDVDFSALRELQWVFVPVPLRYGMTFDLSVFLTLMPIFLVTAMESVGDLTATQALSRLPTSGPAYWARIRGGVVADAFNSLVAALFATFPNTTFSQNNGVIRLTGIASRHIGYVVAGLLILLGALPVVAGVFQVIPTPVIYGATLLMFALIALTGVNILRSGALDRRGWWVAGGGIAGGLLLSQLAAVLPLPDQARLLLGFPVSTGAACAILLEWLLPLARTPEAQPAGR